jgi:hypothetical protein
MRASQAKTRSLLRGIAAIAGVAAAGCLPRGAPPGGRQVIAGREGQLAAIAPPNGDGVLRILFQRPGAADPSTRDLYMLPVDATGQPGTELLLATGLDVTSDLGCIHRLAPFSIDPDGWLTVYGNSGYAQVNAITGAHRDPVTSFLFPLYSDSGDRVFGTDGNSGGSASATGTLTEPDGSTMTFDVAVSNAWGQTYTFFGEDFYYVTPQKDLMHIPPSGAPEKLAAGIDGFSWFSPPSGILILNRPTSDPMVEQSSVLDLATVQETALPFNAISGPAGGGGNASLSPDRRWILHVESDAGVFDFFDYRSGTLQAVPSPAPVGIYPGYSWRPGTSQVWAQMGDYQMPSIWIITPDAAPVLVGTTRFEGVSSPRMPINWAFTADGKYWFSTESSGDVMYPVVQIGDADDPTGPRRDLAPTGMHVDRYWPLGDGRLLTTVFTNDVDRADLMAFDPRTGDDRLLGEKGRVAEVGKTRVLGLLHFQGGNADLTAIDVGTGEQTILAPEFAVTAFAEPQGDDLVAPGTRAVYEFEARSPSPYDGIWVVNVP